MSLSPRYRALVLAGKTNYGAMRGARTNSNQFQDHLYTSESLANPNDSLRFTRLTELCLDDEAGEATWSPNHTDIPLLQITHLDIQYDRYSTDQLLEYLHYLPNVHSLTLESMPSSDSERMGIMRPSMADNSITELVLGDESRRLEDIRRLCQMFPRLQYLTICIDDADFHVIARYLLSKFNDARPRHLCCLFFMNMTFSPIEDMKTMIDLGAPLDDYTAKRANGGWYLWW